MISPESNGWMPAMHLIRVLFPAPLSPTRAVTSPGRTSKSTSRRTWTAPKLLLIPRRDSNSRCCPPEALLIASTAPRCPGPRARSRASRWKAWSSADALLCAGLLEGLARADLVRGGEAVGDDVLDVLREDRLRLEQHALDLLLGLGVLHRARRHLVGPGGISLGQRDRQRRGRVGLLLDRLIDRHTLRAQQHPL